MARRQTPLKTPECLGHRPYRSEYEAARSMPTHPYTTCDKCQRGRVWHVWRHGDHWHVGHASVEAMTD